jgi:type IV secretion system protein VirB8
MNEMELKAFAQASAFWEANEAARARTSERRAWVFAALGLGACVVACVAVALLTPLKTVEPFVVRVDTTTGGADIITRLDQQTVAYNEAIDRYFLGRYVNYREEYSGTLAYSNYEAVSLMSNTQAGNAYFAVVNPKNPDSPSAVYKTEGAVEVSVSSISFLSNHVAQVRFVRTERVPNAEPKVTHWISTISYQYTKTTLDAKARLVNPVGFQVTDYRLDPETTTPAVSS